MSQSPPPEGPDLNKRPDSGGQPPANPYGAPAGGPDYQQPQAPGYGSSTPSYGSGGQGDQSSPAPSYGSTPSYGDQSAPATPNYGGSSYGQTGGYSDASSGYSSTPDYSTPAGAAGYGQPQQYGNYAPAGPSKGLAIAALILGILGLLMSWIPFVGLFGGFLGLIGLIVGIIAMVQANKGRAGGKGLAIGGIITSILAIVTSIAVTVGVVVVAARASESLSSSIDSYSSSLDSSLDNMPTISSDTEDILATKLDVTFGPPEITGDATFPDTKVPVTLTNKSDTAASFSISVVAVKNGIETDTDFVSTDDIEPGGTITTEMFTISSREDLEGATFKVKDATYYPS